MEYLYEGLKAEDAEQALSAHALAQILYQIFKYFSDRCC